MNVLGKPHIDLTGRTFGAWVVLAYAGRVVKGRKIMWRCRCECGKEKVIAGHHLRYGASKSCGCKTAGYRGAALKGEKHYMWRGGSKNVGSLAWCNTRIDSLRQGTKRNGGAPIVGTPEDVLNLWTAAGGICMACGATPATTKNYHLDHDKATGVLRGFVCGTCNVAIGMCGDDPKRLRACAEYLERKVRTV